MAESLNESPEAVKHAWVAELPPKWPPLLGRKLEPVGGMVPRSDDIRILGFNVLADGKQGEEQWECTPVDALLWECRRWRLLEAFIVHQPDAFLLQEVDAKHFEGFFVAQLSRVGYSGNFSGKSGAKPDGVAIFWRDERLKLINHKTVRFSDGSSDVSAVALFRDLATEQELVLASAHLCPGKDEAAELRRHSQVKQLLDHIQRFSGPVPVILATDLNAEPVATEKGGLPRAVPAVLEHQLGLQSAYIDPPYTTWKRRPKGEVCRVIDYMFFTVEAFQRVALLSLPSSEEMPEERLPCHSYPSDHLSLMAVLRFGKAARCNPRREARCCFIL